MNLDLTGKTAIVCGSTQGIGLSTAYELANLGANVTLFARNADKMNEIIPQLDITKGQVHRYILADFDDTEAVKKSITDYLRLVPEAHILINNTGGPAGGPIADALPDQFSGTFQKHLINNHVITQAVLPFMKEAGFGRIVNVISTSVKQPIPGLGVSNTIRWAVASWAKTLSLEVAPFGITVNNVLPGYTRTARLTAVLEMRAKERNSTPDDVAKTLEEEIPTQRFAEPEEVAAAIAFLCSPAAASINGINLPVDGGKTSSL